jgi:hypothetical protein
MSSTPEVYGEYAPTPANKIDLPDGTYEAMIESTTLVRNEQGEPVANRDGKHQVDVYFRVANATDSGNGPVSVRRRFTISYGKNQQNGKWAQWAQFLATARPEVQAGDERQKKISNMHLQGKIVRIVVAENERGYVDIVRLLPKKAAEAQPSEQRAPTAQQQRKPDPEPGERSFLDDDPDSIPF